MQTFRQKIFIPKASRYTVIGRVESLIGFSINWKMQSEENSLNYNYNMLLVV